MIFVFTSCSLSSMKIAEVGSLLLIFSWPCRDKKRASERAGGRAGRKTVRCEKGSLKKGPGC